MKRKLAIACSLLVPMLMAVALFAQTPAASSYAAIEKQIVTMFVKLFAMLLFFSPIAWRDIEALETTCRVMHDNHEQIAFPGA